MATVTTTTKRKLAVVGPYPDQNLHLANLFRTKRPQDDDSFSTVMVHDLSDPNGLAHILEELGINNLVILCSLPDWPLLAFVDFAIKFLQLPPQNIFCIIVDGDDPETASRLEALGVRQVSIADWQTVLDHLQMSVV